MPALSPFTKWADMIRGALNRGAIGEAWQHVNEADNYFLGLTLNGRNSAAATATRTAKPRAASAETNTTDQVLAFIAGKNGVAQSKIKIRGYKGDPNKLNTVIGAAVGRLTRRGLITEREGLLYAVTAETGPVQQAA